MKKINNETKLCRRIVATWLLCGLLLTACGHKTVSSPNQETVEAESEIRIVTETGQDTGIAEERLIKEQTFSVDLNPLGMVTFASYAPDTNKNPFADVVFALSRNGKMIATLEGVCVDNIRSNETFTQVEAVSFIDFNSDGFQDIIVICSYLPVLGPEGESGYSETRIYRGTAEGIFVYEKDVSEDATRALAVQTISSVLDFMGVGQRTANKEISWKQAYIDYLHLQDAGAWQGFTLIWLNDDDIPELAGIGISEANGCTIVNYDKGRVYETALSRQGFSYIERGNLLCNSDGLMDHYYDIVYSLVEDRLVMIAEGRYGEDENSNPRFDEEGRPIYHYMWNNVEVTEEEYSAELKNVYDLSKAKFGYEWDALKSPEEMIEDLENY